MQPIHVLKQQSQVEDWDQQDPEEAFTLPSRYFFDETLFQAERDNIFMHAWHVAGHVNEFAEPGQYVVVDLFDQSVVIAKTAKAKSARFITSVSIAVIACSKKGEGLQAASCVAPITPGATKWTAACAAPRVATG